MHKALNVLSLFCQGRRKIEHILTFRKRPIIIQSIWINIITNCTEITFKLTRTKQKGHVINA